MTKQEKAEITRISQLFSEPFYETFGGINGSGWFIVDPLSGYLNSLGYENQLHEIPEKNNHPQVLIITFKDGTQFIPAGQDLYTVVEGVTNWFWIDKQQ